MILTKFKSMSLFLVQQNSCYSWLGLLLTYFLNQALCHFFRPNDDWQKKFLGQSKVAKANYVQRLVNLN